MPKTGLARGHGYNPNQDDPNYLGSGYVGTGLSFLSDENSMYDAYYKANPYVNQTYRKTWIDDVFGGIFRTGYDKWLNEMQLGYDQYNAGIVDLQQQNFYNSEVAQAQRMRDAGENPDLLGTEGVSDAARTNPDPQDAQIPEAVDAGQVLGYVGKIGMTLLNIIPQSLSFMTDLTKLRGLRMQNDATELAFGESAIDAASKFFTEGITKQDYEAAFNSGDFSNLLDAARKDSDYLTNTFLSSPSARKKFKLAYGMHANSLISEMQKYKTYGEFEEARKQNLTQRSSQFFSDDDATMQELIASVLGPFERYQKRINEINESIAKLRDPELEQGLVNTQLSNQQMYENTIDPQLQAETENAGLDYQKQLYEIMKATDDMFADIMKALDDKDKWYSPIAKALVGIARSQLLSGFHLQFGSRSSSYSNPKSGASAESSGFNFGF